jgi:hypothetical protein
MNVLVFLEHLSQIVDTILEVLASVCKLSVDVRVASLVLEFLLDILLVQSHYALLHLGIVGNCVHALENVIGELLLLVCLLIQAYPEIGDFISQAFLSHAQIVDYQCQILVHSIEVLELAPHLVGLVVEILDLFFSRPNVSLELLDLVV